jgi:2-succinyl-5-enolpyruvyl-6-hydroxy-3-cyclohexene-1-carboxylate synthase
VTPDPNLNALWCRAIAEELTRAGVRRAVLCPGSRNSPLLHALHAQLGDACLSHLDERSAGFIALGLVRAGGGPVAVCVTSGSALANLLPAVAEADASGLPLLVISADRPWELLGCGAPQAMEQRQALVPYVRQVLALGEPSASAATLLALRSQVSRLAQQRGGPLQLNVPLRDPLPPLPDPEWRIPALPAAALGGRADGAPYTIVQRAEDGAAVPPCPWLRPGMRGVVVAGTDHQGLAALAARLAAETGFPLLADAASGLRRPGIANLVTTADALLAGPLGREKPELIIQLGPAPLARTVYEWLARQECPWIACEAGTNQDFLARAWLAFSGGVQTWRLALAALVERCGQGHATWRARWLAAEAAARNGLAQAMAVEPWGEVLAAHRALTHPGFAFLHLASSMAVRHGNLHCPPAIRAVFANRGLNGIDGTLGTFLGELELAKGPGLLLIGDLACLHDLPALAAAGRLGARGAIVVLNNDGGGIFDFLAVAQMPRFRELVRTPHGLDFAGIAGQFGLRYRAVASDADLRGALDAAAADGLHLIECRVEGSAVDRHRALVQTLAASTPA